MSYWNTTTLSCIAYSCFHATMAEDSDCSLKANEILTTLPYTEKAYPVLQSSEAPHKNQMPGHPQTH